MSDDDRGDPPDATPAGPPATTVIAQGRDAEALEDAVLLLSALGVPHDIVAAGEGVALVVSSEHAEAAQHELVRLDEERQPASGEPVLHGGARAGLPTGLALLLGHAVLWWLPAPRRALIYAAGELDASRVRAGEVWRVITALCLHADPAHVVGNAIATAIFVSAAGDRVGPGLALLLTVIAGGIGNVVAAALDAGHHAIGFSTATFGALGLSSVFGFVARYRDRVARRRAWLVLGAGVSLLAILGAGERSDLLAHLLGLGAGAALGGLATRARPDDARVSVVAELGYAAIAVGAIVAAWLAALTPA